MSNDKARHLMMPDAVLTNDVAGIRATLQISQPVLAKLLGCGVFRVRQWEQGVRKGAYIPNADGLLLRLLERHGVDGYLALFGAEDSGE